jgi:putative serine protease PepD
LSDYNRQFLFDAPAAQVQKPNFKQKMAKRTTFLTGTAAITLGALVGGAVGAGVGITAFTHYTRPAPVVVNNTQTVNWVTAAATIASPSVVTLSVAGARSAGNGSGVFLSADGYVLTNAHVVTLGGESSDPVVEVKTFDGRIYQAAIVGVDATNDLAVVKIESAASFTPIEFADSNAVNVGDSVVAIGAPLGLSNTVTNGIVSALNRTIQVASAEVPNNSDGFGGLQFFTGSGRAISLKVIQTDAAINPGNSGGALVNQNGQLVGINVAIASAGSSGQSGNIGVGFAIPSNTAKRIADEIIETGAASHGLLGAAVTDAADGQSTFTTGAEVRELTAGGAAEKAGLLVGDIVIALNGETITSASELTAAVRNEPAGATVTVTVIRDGKEIDLTAVLGNAADLEN